MRTKKIDYLLLKTFITRFCFKVAQYNIKTLCIIKNDLEKNFWRCLFTLFEKIQENLQKVIKIT